MKLLRGFVIVSIIFLGAAPAVASNSRSALNVNDREAVINAWSTEFNRVQPAMEWDGNVAACNGGTTSSAYQQSILQRVNWLRNMAGVPDVAYRADLNAQQQAGALISSANKRLSHTPESTSTCWTQAGYDSTSTSNLYLGVYGAEAMNGYVEDLGDNNKQVGHRWWLLHPGLKSITSGDIPVLGTQWAANALHIFNVDWGLNTSRDGFVAWPPPGYVPGYAIYPRWSVASFGLSDNFSDASVSVTGPNGPLAVTYEYRGAGRIVFIPAGFERAPLKFLVDQTYNVTITGVTGGSRSSYSYSVTAVTTNRTPRVSELNVNSYACAAKGALVGWFDNYDFDGDYPLKYTFVDGEGAQDNAFFTLPTSLDDSFQELAASKNLDGTKLDFTVRLRITDARGASNEGAHSFTLTPSTKACTPAPNASTRTTQRTTSGSITRATSRPLSTYTAIPAGTVTYKTAGNCALSQNNRQVIAGTSRGSCTVTITSRLRKTISIIIVYLQVR